MEEEIILKISQPLFQKQKVTMHIVVEDSKKKSRFFFLSALVHTSQALEASQDPVNKVNR
jgi:hypothetical protein